MIEGKERIERALRGCAEAGVPENVDLWHGILEQAKGKETRGTLRTRFAPRTRMGWAVAVLAALFVMTGAGYAVSGIADKVFRSELPGASKEGDVGVLLDQKQTVNGVAVTLERAYADAGNVVVSFVTEDLEPERRIAGYPAQLMPMIAITEPGYELPPYHVKLTDEDGKTLPVVDGGSQLGEGPMAHTAVFAVPEDLDADGMHRFRLEIPVEGMQKFPPGVDSKGQHVGGDTPLEDDALVQGSELRSIFGPFVFDFEIPVGDVPAVKLDQKVEKNGVTLTLDRIEKAPGRPQAIICLEPPDNEHNWSFRVKRSGSPYDSDEIGDGYLNPVRPMGDGCYTAGLLDKAETYSSLTVTEVEGFPKNGDVDGPEDIKKIRGPWVFDFEVPER